MTVKIKNIIKGFCAFAWVAFTLNAWAGQAITFTANSASKVYDGTALGVAGCTMTGGDLRTHKFFGVSKTDSIDYDSATYTVSGITDAGVVSYKVKSIKIKSHWGTDVTDDYDITYADGGTLTIIPATITSVTLNEPTTFSYTGKDQTVTVKEVKAGDLTPSASEYDVSGTTTAAVGVHVVTVTGKGNYQGSATAMWTIKAHMHNWSYAVATEGNVVTLTATCTELGCLLNPPTLKAVLTLSEGDKAYDGKAITAALTQDAEFETLTGIALGSVTCTGTALDAGTYTFSVSADGTGCNFSKEVTISPRDISDAAITLSATSLSYTGVDQSVEISGVKAGGLDITYDEPQESVRTAKAVGTYTVKVTGKGNFTGTATTDWQITNYSGSIKGIAAAVEGLGTIDGTSLTVTDSSKLEYDADSQTWYAGLALTWEATAKDYEISEYGYAIFTKPELAQMTVDETTFTGAQSGTYAGGKIENTTATLTYKKNIGNEKDCTYLKTTIWRVAITPATIAAAKTAGTITATMYAGALPFSESDDTQRSPGVEFKNYTISIPVDANLKLYDSDGNQVYPEAGYIAQVGNIKYLTLAEALPHATAELPVTLIGNAEAGTFEIGQNITVNLGAFGHADASYKFVNVTDEAKGAKVISTKAENVTTEVTGFAVQNDNNTYTIYRQHNHLWEAVTSGAVLTANCTNETTACDIEGRATSITLTVAGGSDGVAPTFTIDNRDDFLAKINKFSTVASIGNITVTRTTDDGAAYDKWYIGDYKASCVVTVNGEEKTIATDFSIGGEYKAGGYAVPARGVRYDSLSEAVAATEAGGTIVCRKGNLDQQMYDFSVDKNVTIDFGGATFAYTGTDGDMEIHNTGAGVLTMQNVTISQPVHQGTYSKTYHNVSLNGGDFVLGYNFLCVQATSDFAINVMGVDVAVTSGVYQCAFALAEDGAKVEISGGNYLYTDHCKPQAEMIKAGYVLVTRSMEGVGNYYQVVPHTHDYYYETSGNVITLKCKGAGYEGCNWMLNANKLTLTAADAFEGVTYAGASYTYDDSFLFDGAAPEIEYYKDNVRVSVPSTFGDYEARVTVTYNGASATAVKAFAIKHVHQFTYAVSPANVLTATCTNDVSTCDIEGRSTAITLTVTDNGDGVQPTFAVANTEAFLGFVNRDATAVTIGEIATVRLTDDGAATTKWYVGDYRATCAVTAGGVNYTLTNDFSIAKTAEYTSGWAVGSRNIRYDSWEEALAALADTDTIYYRDGTRDFVTHEFSVGTKNLTIDFCGATLKHVSSSGAMKLKNTGNGTLILQNVTIQQPKYGGISYQISVEGNIVFGEGVSAINKADNSDRYLTMTVSSGALIVSNGCYQCGFATSDSGSVSLTGGKYWEYDQPTLVQYSIADHVCREITGDYKYEIVEHTHVFNYTAEGAVISCTCEGTDADYCFWHQNVQTATLTAEDAVETAEPYAGASVAYTEFWAGEKPALTYWQGKTQLEGAPTRSGKYTVTLAIGGVTVEKAFSITSTGPSIVEPTEGDPEETPELKPVEGTNGVYVVEVKTNTTTDVEITGLGVDETVIVPPQIDSVAGTEENPISPSQVKIMADATNATGVVSVDITPAFTITELDNGVQIELNAEAVVTIKIAGKGDEQIAVTPQLGTVQGTEVGESPFAVKEDKVATGVKTIPGLTYHLLCGDTPMDITTIVKTIVAEDTRIVLEAAKDLEKTAQFYKIEVAK